MVCPCNTHHGLSGVRPSGTFVKKVVRCGCEPRHKPCGCTTHRPCNYHRHEHCGCNCNHTRREVVVTVRDYDYNRYETAHRGLECGSSNSGRPRAYGLVMDMVTPKTYGTFSVNRCTR